MKNPPNIALRLARTAQGLSLRDLADAVGGVSYVFIHRLETGGLASVTPEIKAKIAGTLGTTEEILFPNQDGAA